MSLRSFYKMKPSGNLAVVGQPVETNILDSDGKPYYSCKLKNPIVARCSYDKDIDPVEVDEVYMREKDVDDDLVVQEFVNGKDDTDGWFIKGFLYDFIKSHEIVVYQDKTVAKWAQEKRSSRKEESNANINKRIAENKLKRASKS